MSLVNYASPFLENQPSVRKLYFAGTHRCIDPEETLKRWLPAAQAMEITRIANITGLDFLGIPVVLAIRPNARSLSVAQGKGLTLAAASASALMEAAETYHAENAVPNSRDVSAQELRSHGLTVIDEGLPLLNTRKYTPSKRISWSRGVDLLSGIECWVPFDLVHVNYTLPSLEESGYFPLNSSGLASGNHILEAIGASLFELIERDATTLWAMRPANYKAERRIDPNSLQYEACHILLDRLASNGMSVVIWNLTTDIRIPVFLCRIEERSGVSEPIGLSFYGAGCHLCKEIALLRALTEAAQSRLTYISGSRDDLQRNAFMASAEESLLIALLNIWELSHPGCSYIDIESEANSTLNEDIVSILTSLSRVGIRSAVVVDLTRPEFDLPVVRVIVPGLEFDNDDPNGLIGKRAMMAGAGAI